MAVCNLEARGIQQRLRHAYVNSVVLVGLVVVLVAMGAPRASRWVVWVPAFLAAIGYLQVWMRTCVLFGAQGVREDPATIVPVQDVAERRALLWRSIAITAAAVAIGGAFAAVFVLV
jgi:asparagine N-glycosylation enzyme membrane subunit Stt3